VIQRAQKMRPDRLIIANLSGRGDKDVAQAAEFLLEGKKPIEATKMGAALPTS